MSLRDRFPHRVTIQRPTYTQEVDDIGNLETLSDVQSGVHAWVQNASMQEVFEWQKRDENVTNRVGFVANPDLEPGDKILVTSGPSFVGDVLRVIATEDRSAGLGKFWSSMCEIER